jgi:hypothetical protein
MGPGEAQNGAELATKLRAVAALLDEGLMRAGYLPGTAAAAGEPRRTAWGLEAVAEDDPAAADVEDVADPGT